MGRSFVCTTGGTSGGSEPAWTLRYSSISDGATLRWAPYQVISPQDLRDRLGLSGTTGQYSDVILGDYIGDAISTLERACQRFLVNTPGKTIYYTSMTLATLPIPALRVPSVVNYVGSTVVRDQSYWLLESVQHDGVYTGIQFRAWRADTAGPWWIADPMWFDRALDSPFYPGNYGGGYVYTSMPNDSYITGDWGYEPGLEPGDFYHALLILAAWFVMRPPAILADSAITPAGTIVQYSSLPPEVQNYIAQARAGRTAVLIG
jgi:hypothetical protein